MLGKKNNKRHHQIQKIKIAQTMSITKHNKNGTTMRRSKKLLFFFLHTDVLILLFMNGLKMYV